MTFYLIDVPEDTHYRIREFRDAGTRLRNIAKVWRLLGSPKEQALLSFFDHLPERDENNERLLGPDRIVPLLDGLRGLQEAAKARLTDQHWRIRPEELERVQQEAPELIGWAELADKSRLATLSAPLGDAMDLDRYLRDALGWPSRIAID